MAYNWEDKRADCERLYLESNLSLEEVMKWLKTERGFAPSRRAFETQFKKWNFPSKQSPLEEDDVLVARVKELWEADVGQRDMLQQLNHEGFTVTERELMRLRGKRRWLLHNVGVEDSAPGLAAEVSLPQRSRRGRPSEQPPVPPLEQLDPAAIEKRQEVLQKRQAESDERWAARKRRRRTRDWAGLPADPEGPPRFPSETTLDESKIVLQLDNDTYRKVREQFQAICEQEGIVKKTLAGPDKWQEAKDRLVRENKHLDQVLYHDDKETLHQKLLSLDVVCLDVTKRMRVMQTRVTISDAKNALAINPEESRQLRATFFAKLKKENFTSKTDLGQERWDQLKEEWVSESPLLQRLLDPADPEQQSKLRAVEMLCRDVMKRLRDEMARRDPSRQKQRQGIGPGPTTPRPSATTGHATTAQSSQTPVNASSPGPAIVSSFVSDDLQIDPSLLLAASDALPHMLQDEPQDNAYLQDIVQPPDASASYAQQQKQSAPTGIFMRLHQDSPWQTDPKLWLGALSARTMTELRQQITASHPTADIVRIAGILKTADGTEVSYGIDDDAKLGGYLLHTNGGDAMFEVMLASMP